MGVGKTVPLRTSFCCCDKILSFLIIIDPVKDIALPHKHTCKTLLCKIYSDYDSCFVCIFKLVIVLVKRVPIKRSHLLALSYQSETAIILIYYLLIPGISKSVKRFTLLNW